MQQDTFIINLLEAFCDRWNTAEIMKHLDNCVYQQIAECYYRSSTVAVTDRATRVAICINLATY